MTTIISSQTVASLDNTHLASSVTKTLDDTQVLIIGVASGELNIPLDGSDLTFIPKGRGNNPQRGKTQEGQATKSKSSSRSTRDDSSTKSSSGDKSGTSSKDKTSGSSKNKTRTG